MARRGRLKAPPVEYRSADGDVLALRASMTVGTRRQYQDALGGSPLSQEDAWHRGGRVPVRAAGGELGGRRRGPHHAPEGAARALPRWPRRTSGAGSATCCASTSPSTSPSCRRRDAGPGSVRRAVVRLLPRGRSRASRSSCAPRRSRRRCSLALQRAFLEREAWPHPAGRAARAGGRRSGPPRATCTSTRSRRSSSWRRRETDASIAIHAPENTRAFAGRRSRAACLAPLGAGAGSRGGAGAAVVRVGVADAGAGAARGHVVGGLRGVRVACAVPRS